jgi:hypothetical protein
MFKTVVRWYESMEKNTRQTVRKRRFNLESDIDLLYV